MKKTVLITGASSGFGKESAKLFQKNGWNVVATMRSPENGKELAQLENILVTYLDVNDKASIVSAIQTGLDKFGGIDVLINSAGFAVMGIFETATEDQVRDQYATNVFGLMRVTKAVLPHMRKNGRGVIVNISSVAGRIGLPFASIYESSKFAVEGFSEALFFELYKLGILVKLVEPGSSDTNFSDAKEMTANSVESYQEAMNSFFTSYHQKTKLLVKAAPQAVASTIYKAATDTRRKLRYVIGEDCQFFVDIKTQDPEEEFVSKVDDFFKS